MMFAEKCFEHAFDSFPNGRVREKNRKVKNNSNYWFDQKFIIFTPNQLKPN